MRILSYLFIMVAMSACAVNRSATDCEACDTLQADTACTFATKLFGAVNAAADNENICISPASARWALAMTANGACGATATEMYTALGYPVEGGRSTAFDCLQKKNIQTLGQSEYAEINIANSLWAHKNIKLKDAFIADNEYFYGAEIKNTAFDDEGIKSINDWCSRQTDGKITSIVEKLSPATRLLLINALYFKAGWANPFNERATYKAPFTLADGTTVMVDMMHRTEQEYYHEDSIMQATALQFERGEYSLLLILPKEGVAMQQVVDMLEKHYDKNFARVKKCLLQLSVPKFTVEFGTTLKPILQKMGMEVAFTADADFGNISKTSLMIDDVLQKSRIALDEQGVEAAAVTAVQMRLTSMLQRDVIVMDVNRPFIYAIIHNATGDILFIGKTGNPADDN